MFGKKKKKEYTDFFDTLREETSQPEPDLDFSPWPQNPPKNEKHLYRGYEVTEYQWKNSTGSNYNPDSHGYLTPPPSDRLEFNVEALWEKMYEHAMAVIVVCSYCSTPQAIANGTCMRCGGALPKPKPLGGKT